MTRSPRWHIEVRTHFALGWLVCSTAGQPGPGRFDDIGYPSRS
jgi:hypothetical protein